MEEKQEDLHHENTSFGGWINSAENGMERDNRVSKTFTTIETALLSHTSVTDALGNAPMDVKKTILSTQKTQPTSLLSQPI